MLEATPWPLATMASGGSVPCLKIVQSIGSANPSRLARSHCMELIGVMSNSWLPDWTWALSLAYDTGVTVRIGIPVKAVNGLKYAASCAAVKLPPQEFT